jgi:predicted nucleotidyltransferase
VTREAVAAVLRDTVRAFESAGVPYVLIGGLASTVLGRARTTEDIDLLVFEADAKRALEALARAGFDTDETNPEWIYKATRDGIEIDLIFWLKGDVYLDDEMLSRAHDGDVDGVPVKVVPPEDLIVIKAAVHDEQTPRHWHDALGVIAEQDLDWDYLGRRARHSARRVLALLIYAQSNDLVVTDDTIKSIYESVYGD